MSKTSKISELLKKEKILAMLKDTQTKGDAKKTLLEGLIVTPLIAVAGAYAGKEMGRPSLLYGAAFGLLGHYIGSGRLTCFGASVMAGGALAPATVGGLGATTFTEKVKQGIKNIGQDLKHRLYVDKFIQPKANTTTNTNGNGTNGLGDVQYFKYPGMNEGMGATGELDMSALNTIENEIMRSTQAQKHQMRGYDEDVSGIEDRIL